MTATRSTAGATSFPPGPRMPAPLQTLAVLTRQRPFLERARRRHGGMFRLRLLGLGDLVVVSDPALVKQAFTADPKVLYAGERSPLRPVLGPHSLLAIDGDRHLEQRRLLLPPFKGQRVKTYESLIERIAIAEIETWPEGVSFTTAEPMQRITLRAILQAVFGAAGRELAELEELMPPWTERGSSLSRLPSRFQADWGRFSPWGRLVRLRAEIDTVLDRLIEMARTDPQLEERADVLALMVQATHTDGTPMDNAEIRDQLVTMLAAGHETTAHTLSWAVERLSRHPEVAARLTAEADAGGKALRDATIREVQRQRPVIAFAGRSVEAESYELGGYDLPHGTVIGLAASLTHFDPRLFPEPDRFDPDRFLDRLPDTYSWIPFGGGMRRCIGATFAHLEMEVVLRVLLERVELVPTTEPDEPWSFRGVAWTPAAGGRVTVRHRRTGETAARTPAVAA